MTVWSKAMGPNDISYSVVRLYVKDRRKEVRRQARAGPDAMFVSQTHLPGAEADVESLAVRPT